MTFSIFLEQFFQEDTQQRVTETVNTHGPKVQAIVDNSMWG